MAIVLGHQPQEALHQLSPFFSENVSSILESTIAMLKCFSFISSCSASFYFCKEQSVCPTELLLSNAEETK